MGEGLWLLLSLQLTDLSGQVEETLPHVAVVLGTGLEEQHVMELCISLEGGGREGGSVCEWKWMDERERERERGGNEGRVCVIGNGGMREREREREGGNEGRVCVSGNGGIRERGREGNRSDTNWAEGEWNRTMQDSNHPQLLFTREIDHNTAHVSQ